MEARQLVVDASFAEDSRQGTAADEAGESHAEGSRRANELHPAIRLENFERQGEHVTRHAL